MSNRGNRKLYRPKKHTRFHSLIQAGKSPTCWRFLPHTRLLRDELAGKGKHDARKGARR